MNKGVYVIAEAGVNHQGSEAMAYKLIDVAIESGADCVKFQTFKAEKLVDASAPLAAYQVRQMDGAVQNQYELLKSLEFNEDVFTRLKNYCDKKGIAFLSTAFDEESLDFLVSLGIAVIKIPSGELTNLPYLRKAASYGLPVILSTGMADIEEVQASIRALLNAGLSKDKITVLHCTTEYPAPADQLNMLAMKTLSMETGCKVGYSDHSEGDAAAIIAVALGATIIEKHFTLDKTLPGPDHQASMEPVELKNYISKIRATCLMLGSASKFAGENEAKNKIVARKSIFFARDLGKGHILTEKDLIMKRPGNGVSPMELDSVLGKELIHEVQMGERFDWNTVIV
jgi:N,N'-diacetyllegionaminate synthase